MRDHKPWEPTSVFYQTLLPMHQVETAEDYTRGKHSAKQTNSASRRKHLCEKYRYAVCRLYSSRVYYSGHCFVYYSIFVRL